MKKKTKEELDVLSQKEISDYRYKFLSGMQHPFKDDENIYLKELEFYNFVRFKQEQIDTYERWKAEAIAWEEAGKDLEDLSYRGKALLKNLDSEELYKLSFDSDMKELPPFKFIKIEIC